MRPSANLPSLRKGTQPIINSPLKKEKDSLVTSSANSVATKIETKNCSLEIESYRVRLAS